MKMSTQSRRSFRFSVSRVNRLSAPVLPSATKKDNREDPRKILARKQFSVLHKNLNGPAILAALVVPCNLIVAVADCCGNVGTRVLCGFPSSEGAATRRLSQNPQQALGAPFP